MITDFFNVLSDALALLNIFFAAIVVFYERKDPATTWAWLIVILIIPYFGFAFYLIFGLDSRKRVRFYKKSIDDDKVYQDYLKMDITAAKYISEQKENFFAGDYISQYCDVLKCNPHLKDLVYLNIFSGNGAFTSNNSVKLYHDGTSKFKDLLEDIASAKNFIHMQYYIVKNDVLGNEIITLLTKKAQEGVEVRFHVDGMGSYRTPKKFYKPLIKAGGKLSVFLPPYFVRINFRNHRKIAIIDGEIGYIGGLNIGDEYVSKKRRFGFWRDTHIRVVGDAVSQLQLRFVMDWNHNSVEKIPIEPRYFKSVANDGNSWIQIVSCGPDTKWPSIKYAYTKMISEADRSIYIQTPYFVPDESAFEAIRIAALSGIDVRIMIPAKPDHPFVYWAALSYLGDLLKAGVKCYEYQKGFVHSKLVVVDGLVASVGTANMDVRSFKLNFETNSFIFDQNIASELEHQYLIDIETSREISLDTYNKRSGVTKIKESVSRLLSPLL